MLDNLTFQYIAAAVSALGIIIAWLAADSSFKGKILGLTNDFEASEVEVKNLKSVQDTMQATVQSRFDFISTQNTRSEQDRAELHRLVDKLDASKASKEMVEAFKQEILILRLEMDKRFDRLDRMLEYRMMRTDPKILESE